MIVVILIMIALRAFVIAISNSKGLLCFSFGMNACASQAQAQHLEGELRKSAASLLWVPCAPLGLLAAARCYYC